MRGQAREQVQAIDHPVLGTRLTITPPYRMSQTPPKIRGTAPCLGADNDYVFGELLGMDRAELPALALKVRGATWGQALARPPWRRHAAARSEEGRNVSGYGLESSAEALPVRLRPLHLPRLRSLQQQ